MASKNTFLIWVALILCVFSLRAIKLDGASELQPRWYEMTKSRRLLGQEQTGPTKGGGSSLIGKPKNKPYDDPCCHNYYHP
ncbi:hypothetical protein MtrunA17_Chr8g0337701 [Medicago truncatula]|uniref:Transmembrane protein n=1 Tax=Medicago truncatula TaxID=3880 RepID=A0A396GF22_MEDTR|nr:hypothetical protein MtrunA17_Chr8g0337701 [Medicago truncatula]